MDIIEKMLQGMNGRQIVGRDEAFSALNLKIRYALALGTEPFLYDDIKATYKSNKIHYYNLYKKSEFYNSVIFESYPTKTNEQLIYAVGILEENDTSVLMRLMKRGYRNAYNYVNNSGKVVDATTFSEKILAKFEASGENMLKEIDMLNQMSALFFFAEVLRKPVELIQGHPLEDMFKRYLTSRLVEVVNNREIIQRALKENKVALEKFKEVLVRYNTKNVLFENFCELTVVAEQKDIFGYLGTLEQREATFKRGFLSRYIAFYNTYLVTLGLGEEVLGTQMITSEDLERISFHITNGMEDLNFEFNDISGLFITLVFLTALTKEYKETRQSYLKKDMEESVIQAQDMLEKAQEKDKEKIAKAESLIHDYATLKGHLKTVNNNMRALEKDFKAKEREVKSLTSQLESAQKQVEVLQKENEQLVLAKDEMYKMKERICKMENILFIGGNTNWVKRTQELLPKAQFIDIDKNMDYSHIANFDGHIIVNTATNNHGFMYGIKTILEGRDYKMLNSNHGVERTIEEVYELIK